MLLTLGSFLCDTWTLAPVNPLRELDMGSSLCFPMGGHTTRAPLWPSLRGPAVSWGGGVAVSHGTHLCVTVMAQGQNHDPV